MAALMASQTVQSVQIGPRGLPGELTWSARAVGLVVFAHGSGSSRNSPRNQFVARALCEAGLGTLLFDLLTRGRKAGCPYGDTLCLRQELLAACHGRPAAIRCRPLDAFQEEKGAAFQSWS